MPGRSYVGFALAWELRKVWPDLEEEPHLAVNGEHPGRRGKRKSVEQPDILVPSLRLVIEYDGLHFHRQREREDRDKNRRLIDSGYSVLRIRETGLPPISDWGAWDMEVRDIDVRCRPDAIVRQVLTRLLALGLELPRAAAVYFAAPPAGDRDLVFARWQAVKDARKARADVTKIQKAERSSKPTGS